MTQHTFPDIDPYVDDGIGLSSNINNWKKAVESSHSGATRPSYATAGMLWEDTSANPSLLRLYDGTNDVIPSVGTVEQFDSSTKIANMASVQRALGNFAGTSAYTTTSTIAAADAGKIINASGTITLTLPLGADVVTGCSFQINNNGTGTVTVQANTGNSLYGIGKTVTRTFVLGTGDSVTIAYHGSNKWYGWGGLQLGASSSFGASLAANGYQKLPSGLIIQWGWVASSGTSAGNAQATLPMTFPNAILSVLATIQGGTGGPYTVLYTSSTTSTVTFTTSLSGSPVGGIHVSYLVFGF